MCFFSKDSVTELANACASTCPSKRIQCLAALCLKSNKKTQKRKTLIFSTSHLQHQRLQVEFKWTWFFFLSLLPCSGTRWTFTLWDVPSAWLCAPCSCCTCCHTSATPATSQQQLSPISISLLPHPFEGSLQSRLHIWPRLRVLIQIYSVFFFLLLSIRFLCSTLPV